MDENNVHLQGFSKNSLFFKSSMPGNNLGKILLISLIENTIKIEFENKIKMAITRNVKENSSRQRLLFWL